MKNKVVVTGMGLASPIGSSLVKFTESLFSGTSGINLIRRFDASNMPTKIAGEVKDISGLETSRDVKILFAHHALEQAMKQAGIENEELGQRESGVSIGIGLELFSMKDLVKTRVNPAASLDQLCDSSAARMTFLNTPSDFIVQSIKEKFSFRHSAFLSVSACSASTDAIGVAYRQIQRGSRDLVVAGGTDSMINPMGLAGFCRIGALSTENEIPSRASRPFDRNRKGFVMGEGAGFLVLENERSALKRGAEILAEISGYGNSLDGYSASDPHPDGEGASRAMRKAIQDAGLVASDISAISLHGTGTPKNDPAEAKALRKVFSERINEVPAFATKSLMGHLISAGGAVETIAAIQSIVHSELHPTLNLENVDEGCELNHVLKRQRKQNLNHILKNSFGFGGLNSCLLISRWR